MIYEATRQVEIELYTGPDGGIEMNPGDRVEEVLRYDDADDAYVSLVVHGEEYPDYRRRDYQRAIDSGALKLVGLGGPYQSVLP